MQLSVKELKSIIRERIEKSTEEKDEKILSSVGLKVLRSGKKQSAYLGEGAYARVYEILWHDKRAVAKIVRRGEALRYDAIGNMRSKLPAHVAAVLPEIYEVIHTNDFMSSVVVSEYLLPTTPDIKLSYFYHHEGNKTREIEQNADVLINDPDRFIDVAEACGSKRSDFTEEERKTVVRAVRDYLTTYSADFQYETKISELRRILQVVNGSNAMYIFGDELNGQRFPISSNSPLALPRLRAPERILQFRQALDDFKHLTGTTWADIHSDNVRVRQKTGELVVSDIGNFMLPDDV